MVTSVAVLSDIHGVLPVLEAVLAEADVDSADLIVVTGDHAAGPQPVAVLDRLAALGERVVLVRGNADRELVALAQGHASTVGQAYEVDLWAAFQLSTEHVELLAGLPHPITVNIEGFGPVVFCHGTPRDDEEVVLVGTCLQRWAEVFADLPEDVRTVVCGHTPHALRAPGGPAPGHQPRQHRHALRPAGRAGGRLLGAATRRRRHTAPDRPRRGGLYRGGGSQVDLSRPPGVGRGLPAGHRQRRRGPDQLRSPRRPQRPLTFW